jgi:hypothetical protein
MSRAFPALEPVYPRSDGLGVIEACHGREKSRSSGETGEVNVLTTAVWPEVWRQVRRVQQQNRDQVSEDKFPSPESSRTVRQCASVSSRHNFLAHGCPTYVAEPMAGKATSFPSR